MTKKRSTPEIAKHSNQMKKFRDIKLGFTEAETESARQPNLLLQGFYDLNNMLYEAKDGAKFLFLGYKGSGKSALGEHLKLTAQRDSNLFVSSTFLKDFPYTDFAGIIRGDVEPESQYPTAWAWLLLVYLFNSFVQDEGSPSNSDPDFLTTIETLRKLGILSSPSLRQVVLAASKQSFKFSLPTLFESNSERTAQEQGYNIPFFVQRLKSTAQSFQSDSKHLLIIDGLDDILAGTKVQYDSLSGLIFEVSRLNTMFMQYSVPAKIILLCRTDLFERLPNANKNKIRQDSAIVMDWYNNPRKPDESMLINMVNQKARVSDPNIKDIFHNYFPSHMELKYENRDIRRWLLDWTRHTPRDFIQVLSYIQQFSDHDQVTEGQIWSGVREYSISYFLPEIKDELSGYVSPDDIDTMITLISSLRLRDFDYSQLEKMSKDRQYYAHLDLPKIISALFECSAVGNIYSPSGTKKIYYSFKYRNRQSTLNLEERITLHKGLWKALNLL